jgi:hypothetical protein
VPGGGRSEGVSAKPRRSAMTLVTVRLHRAWRLHMRWGREGVAAHGAGHTKVTRARGSGVRMGMTFVKE